MAKVNINPQAVLLTSGQAATFEATDDKNVPLPLKWSLNPPTAAIGSLVDPSPPGQTSSATYIAPTVGAEQTVAVVASGADGTASATIFLTPDAISIVPAKVELKPGQEQKFVAVVAGAAEAGPASAVAGQGGAAPVQGWVSPEQVTWILSPPVGVLTPSGSLGQEALYKAAEVQDSTTVNVIATTEANGKHATAVVSLSGPPWTGRGVQLLGLYLLVVFCLVFLIVLLWPPAVPSPETARADRSEAEKAVGDKTIVLQEKTSALEKAEDQLRKAKADLNAQQSKNQQANAAGAKGQTGAQDATNTGGGASAPTTSPEYDAAVDAQARAKQAQTDAATNLKHAQTDLEAKQENEKNANDPGVETLLAGKINREMDLLWLVLLAGALGAFLHMSQSFSDYIGNRTLKDSWAWWYYFRPFIGAGLALVFYAAIRGGFMAMATGTNSKASELNAFGIVGVSALVGMFSKAATMKLGEVFDTLFKTDKAKEQKDKLAGGAQPSQSGSAAAAGGSSGATAK